MSTGLLDLSPLGYLLAVLILTHVTIASVTIYLHRAQAHRALDLHPALAHCFRLWIWLTTGMRTVEWVAIHRKHHAHTEREDDPHSPHRVGIWKVLLQGTELYKAEARNPETLEKYGHGTPDDWIERNVYARLGGIGGIAIMGVLALVLFGAIGVTIWAIQMIWIPLWAAGVINGLGHYLGYRNFESPDGSTNIFPLGVFIGGEELHNNHHAFPSSARFSQRWYEFDLGWAYIRLFERLGLARVKRVAPRPCIDPARRTVDLETVRAVIVGRMHVMRTYARQVTLPVLKSELGRADAHYRRLLARARKALVRDESRMDERARARRDAALHANRPLQTVYEYRRRLQQLFVPRGWSQEGLVQALQEWCASAEASGIESLRRFAERLRGYRLEAAT
ncbi:MAG: fatty acid desaturase [Halofilum sp. (in: g-proteobacteria)]|nr:fatty acid desaturase [Halofilum sp. (in: g-proteobacteria)]